MRSYLPQTASATAITKPGTMTEMHPRPDADGGKTVGMGLSDPDVKPTSKNGSSNDAHSERNESRRQFGGDGKCLWRREVHGRKARCPPRNQEPGRTRFNMSIGTGER